MKRFWTLGAISDLTSFLQIAMQLGILHFKPARFDDDLQKAADLKLNAERSQVMSRLSLVKRLLTKLAASTAVEKPDDICHKPLSESQATLLLEMLDDASSEIGLSYVMLLQLEQYLENQFAQLELAGQFGFTAMTFRTTGWVPADQYDRFVQTLRALIPSIIVGEDPGQNESDETPYAPKVRTWTEPYGLFLRLFGTPRATSIDPVPFVSIFFPIFFGSIVGDIGYGLLLCALAFWGLLGFPGLKLAPLRKLCSNLNGREILQVLLHAGVSSILFGLIFGEVFGRELRSFGVSHGIWPINRSEHIFTLLWISIAVGFVQQWLGFALGIVTAWRHRDGKEVITLSATALTIPAVGLIMLALLHLGQMWMLYAGVAILAAITITLLISNGFVALVHAVSSLIHVVSYSRLMGFGLASSELSHLINSISEPGSAVAHASIGTMTIPLLVLILHLLNFSLHIFEGLIQSARLHWVEFFDKFVMKYLDGTPYKPFGLNPQSKTELQKLGGEALG